MADTTITARVRIQEMLWRRMLAAARLAKTPVQDLVAEAIRQYLERKRR